MLSWSEQFFYLWVLDNIGDHIDTEADILYWANIWKAHFLRVQFKCGVVELLVFPDDLFLDMSMLLIKVLENEKLSELIGLQYFSWIHMYFNVS